MPKLKDWRCQYNFKGVDMFIQQETDKKDSELLDGAENAWKKVKKIISNKEGTNPQWKELVKAQQELQERIEKLYRFRQLMDEIKEIKP